MTHPGEVFDEEYRKPLKLSFVAVSGSLNWPMARLKAFIKGTRTITADEAIALELLTGSSAEFWLRLQMHHDLQSAYVKRGMVYNVQTDRWQQSDEAH